MAVTDKTLYLDEERKDCLLNSIASVCILFSYHFSVAFCLKIHFVWCIDICNEYKCKIGY